MQNIRWFPFPPQDIQLGIPYVISNLRSYFSNPSIISTIDVKILSDGNYRLISSDGNYDLVSTDNNNKGQVSGNELSFNITSSDSSIDHKIVIELTANTTYGKIKTEIPVIIEQETGTVEEEEIFEWVAIQPITIVVDGAGDFEGIGLKNLKRFFRNTTNQEVSFLVEGNSTSIERANITADNDLNIVVTGILSNRRNEFINVKASATINGEERSVSIRIGVLIIYPSTTVDLTGYATEESVSTSINTAKSEAILTAEEYTDTEITALNIDTISTAAFNAESKADSNAADIATVSGVASEALSKVNALPSGTGGDIPPHNHDTAISTAKSEAISTAEEYTDTEITALNIDTISTAASNANSKADSNATDIRTVSTAASNANSKADSNATDIATVSTAASNANSKADSNATDIATVSNAASTANSKATSNAATINTVSGVASSAKSEAVSNAATINTVSGVASSALSRADSNATDIATVSTAASNANSKADSNATDIATVSTVASEALSKVNALPSDSSGDIPPHNHDTAISTAKSEAISTAEEYTDTEITALDIDTISTAASNANSKADSNATDIATVSTAASDAFSAASTASQAVLDIDPIFVRVGNTPGTIFTIPAGATKLAEIVTFGAGGTNTAVLITYHLERAISKAISERDAMSTSISDVESRVKDLES